MLHFTFLGSLLVILSVCKKFCWTWLAQVYPGFCGGDRLAYAELRVFPLKHLLFCSADQKYPVAHFSMLFQSLLHSSFYEGTIF